jgi:hypothetical protein
VPTVTANQGLTIPAGADPANAPTAFTAFAGGVENRLVQRFASVADRTARNPTPNEGELSYLVDLNTISYFNNAGWEPYRNFVRRTANSTAVNNSTVLVNDGVLTLPVLANAIYQMELFLIYNSNATADFKIAFTAPAGAAMTWGQLGLDTAVAGAGSVAGDVRAGVTTIAGNLPYGGAGADACGIAVGVLVMAGTAGTLTVQFAQNTANVSNTTIQAGSALWLKPVS